MEGRKARSRTLLLVILSSVLGTLLGGCLHVNTALTISGEDTVSGEVLVVTQSADGQVPFRLQPPGDMADRVEITPYQGNDGVGSRMSFHDLEFDEVERLAGVLSPSDSRYRLSLSRSGSLVILNGSVDLTPLADTDSGVELKVSAPGEITNTNGTESAGTVNWVLEPGEVTELSATFQYADATGGDWIGWAVGVTLLTLGTAAVVGLLALRAHLRNRTPV